MGYLVLLIAGLLVAKKAAEDQQPNKQTPEQQLVEQNISRSVPSPESEIRRISNPFYYGDAPPISRIGQGAGLDANNPVTILPAPGFGPLPKNVTPPTVDTSDYGSSSGGGARGGAGGASSGFGPPAPPGGFHFFN